jgi:hypothetical protein
MESVSNVRPSGYADGVSPRPRVVDEYGLAGSVLAVGAGVVIAAFAWGGLPAPGIAPNLTDSGPTAAIGILAGVFGALLLWMVHGLRGIALAVAAGTVGLGVGALIFA